MLKKFKQEYPRFKHLFQFQQFNQVQKQCFPKIFNSTQNMIVSAPTSSGKTVLFELLIAKLISQKKTKCLYLAPIKSLCHQKATNWRKKFLSSMHIMQLTGDTLQSQPGQFDNADIYIATPQKIDYISRKNLQFIKQLRLLLIDQIHMLNMEDRGAILQAIVSRIMSISQNIRIMAVSATIPNIKEVAEWLKVPKHLICVFGEEYRPAKLHKVVLGFKSANNDFNFQKMLNFKILQVIRDYSSSKGTLIFCQTQKGTEQACNKIISQASQRQFIQNQGQVQFLTKASKRVDSLSLRQLLPHGVAFHNASLSLKDRSVVEDLFLDLKVKVLCTTSTLAMGINLPARLVIIKSTKCYKGSGKGYQQYSQIQLDQMMGRAGRIPFDKQGTVVIMTQKSNYNKYVGQIKLQNLQSQLYSQLIDHLNTEISLRSIHNLSSAMQYFKNSFCYIRMLNSPKLYNLSSRNQVESFVKQTCLKSIKRLFQYEIIQYIQPTQKLIPKQCSHNISRNAIEVQTIINVIQSLNNQTTLSQKQFIQLLCKANELSSKYRSKLDQRKYLKTINQKNKYPIKETISNAHKKLFVLIQAQLSGIHIENWQLRRQAQESVYFFRRLAYCVKMLALQKKHSHKTFWMHLYASLFHKYFSQGFWEANEEKVLRQIKKVDSKWKNISARGIRTLKDLTQGLNKLDIFGNNISSTAIKKDIQQQLDLLNGSLQISLRKAQQHHPYASDAQNQPYSSHISTKQTNHLLKLVFTHKFTASFRMINVLIQLNNSIYHTGFISPQNPQFSVYLKSTSHKRYFISIVKDSYVGFDQYYWCEYGGLRKAQIRMENVINNNKKLPKNSESLDYLQEKIDKKTDKKKSQGKSQSLNSQDQQQQQQQTRLKTISLLQSSISSRKFINKNNKIQKTQNKGQNLPIKINFVTQKPVNKQKMGKNSVQEKDQPEQYNVKPEQHNVKPEQYNVKTSQSEQNEQKWQKTDSSTVKINFKSKQLKLTQNFNSIKKKYIFDEESQQKQAQLNPLGKTLRRSSYKQSKYRDLKSYNWKPGFQQIKDLQNQSIYDQESKGFDDKQTTNKQHKLKKSLLLSEQPDTRQDTQEFRQTNEKYSDIKIQLNDYMNEMYQPSMTTSNQIPKGKYFQNYTNQKNNLKTMHNTRKYPLRLDYVPQLREKVTQFQQNHQNRQDFISGELKSLNQNYTEISNFHNKKYTYQGDFNKRQQKKRPSQIIFNNKIRLDQSNNSRRNSQNQIQYQKKSYKNAYDYFQSCLTDQQDN